MLTSILSPAVGRDRNPSPRRPWFVLAAWHSLGSVVSATLLGAILVAAARWVDRAGIRPGSWRWDWATGVVVSLVLLYLPRELGWTRWPPLLQSTCQVPRRWSWEYPRWATALLFGLGLGN